MSKNVMQEVLDDVERGTIPAPEAIALARKEVKNAEKIRRHARALYQGGQLDKSPSSDSGAEYKLWRLVKRRGE